MFKLHPTDPAARVLSAGYDLVKSGLNYANTQKNHLYGGLKTIYRNIFSQPQAIINQPTSPMPKFTYQLHEYSPLPKFKYELENLCHREIPSKIPNYELIPVKKESFVDSALSYAKGAVETLKQVPGKVQKNVITPLTATVKEVVTNPNTYIYTSSALAGAVSVGAAVSFATNVKSQGLKKQLPTLALMTVGLVTVGLNQVLAGPGHRDTLALTSLVSGVFSGAYVGISQMISSKKAAQV